MSHPVALGVKPSMAFLSSTVSGTGLPSGAVQPAHPPPTWRQQCRWDPSLRVHRFRSSCCLPRPRACRCRSGLLPWGPNRRAEVDQAQQTRGCATREGGRMRHRRYQKRGRARFGVG
eukprot:5121708-Alexandrium_andersonii.AAC.1